MAKKKTTTTMQILDTKFFTLKEQETIRKINAVKEKLDNHFVERSSAIEVMFVSLLAKHHTLFIGPPGLAKSQLIEEMLGCFTGYELFKWQINKFTTPDDLMGKPSLAALRNDQFVRVTEHKLPEANIAYIDEVLNANNSTLNVLNGAMNERTFEGMNFDLLSVFGATNTVPRKTDLELAAFIDRWLFKLIFGDIHDSRNFKKLLKIGVFKIDDADKIDRVEIDALIAKVPKVKFVHQIQKLSNVRAHLRKEEISCSPRRWKQSIEAMQARAILNGRSSINGEDMYILKFILWSEKKNIPVIEECLDHYIDPILASLKKLTGAAQNIKDSIEHLDIHNQQENQAVSEGMVKLNRIIVQVEEIGKKDDLPVDIKVLAEKITDRVKEIRDDISNKIWT